MAGYEVFVGCGRGRKGEDRYCRDFEAGFGGVVGLFVVVVDVGGVGDVVDVDAGVVGADMWRRHP